MMAVSGTMTRLSYSTNYGMMLQGKAESALRATSLKPYLGKVHLIFTSPPFPLNRKKAYGNLTGTTYEEWLAGFAQSFVDFLEPDGSIVIEIGNSWNRGEPTMSTLGLKSPLEIPGKREPEFVPTVCVPESCSAAFPGSMGKHRTNQGQGFLYSHLVDVAHSTASSQQSKCTCPV